MKRIVHEEQSQREIRQQGVRILCASHGTGLGASYNWSAALFPRYGIFERAADTDSGANQGGTAEAFRSLFQGWKVFFYVIFRLYIEETRFPWYENEKVPDNGLESGSWMGRMHAWAGHQSLFWTRSGLAANAEVIFLYGKYLQKLEKGEKSWQKKRKW